MFLPKVPARPRAVRRILAVALLTGTVVLLAPGPALAHSALSGSDPVHGAVLPIAPAAVTLEFNEDVAPEFVNAALTLGTATPVPITTTAQGPVVTLIVPSDLASSGAGQEWQVAYRVVSADGHPISGSLGFSVNAGASPSATSPESPVETPAQNPVESPTETPAVTPAESPATSQSLDPAANSTQSSSGASPLVWATGLAAAAGAVAGTVVVLARRRRRS